jgi:uncharacterized membrane protein YdjX (TVP38/TMEM64 family)
MTARVPRLVARLAVMIAACCLAAAVIVGFIAAHGEADLVLERGRDVLRAAAGLGPAGWLALVGAQTVIAAVGVVPASLLAVAAGTLYGLVPGFLLAASATLAGALISFWLSRSAFRPLLHRAIARRTALANIDASMARDGWRIVCLFRINPIMPFAPTSFLLGLSGVTTRNYMLGTLASLPALLLYVAAGTLARSGLEVWHGGAGRLNLAVGAFAVAATLALSARLAWLMRQRGGTDSKPQPITMSRRAQQPSSNG